MDFFLLLPGIQAGADLQELVAAVGGRALPRNVRLRHRRQHTVWSRNPVPHICACGPRELCTVAAWLTGHCLPGRRHFLTGRLPAARWLPNKPTPLSFLKRRGRL